jgi:LPPG:FO 2-phospho-L-lactate transferase
MITALCGGVGGSKLALGLYLTVPGDELAVVVNTADDLDFCGLHVSPDLDTVTYTLAGISRADVGWGIEGDTFQALQMLARYGAPTWFQVGDRDLATHVIRTERLQRGHLLTDVTLHIARGLGVRAAVLPMTDEKVATRLQVGDEWIDFQDYFVLRHHADPVEAVRYDGIDEAPATERVQEVIESADVVVLVNSNPVLSILPILETPGINDLIASSAAPRVAVSPIVGSNAVSGPAGDLMRLIGQPASATGVANAYLGLIDGVVIDRQDQDQAAGIEALGLRVLCTDTIMRDTADRERLAREVLAFARTLR